MLAIVERKGMMLPRFCRCMFLNIFEMDNDKVTSSLLHIHYQDSKNEIKKKVQRNKKI